MTSLIDMVWDTDIARVLNRIRPSDCADPEYFYATVDLIEDGRSPTGAGRLTLGELEAWVVRLKKGPDANVKDQTRIDVPPDNDVPYSASREDHRPVRQIHPSSSRSTD